MTPFFIDNIINGVFLFLKAIKMSLQMSFLVMSIAFFLLLGIVRGEADFSDGITKRNMQSVDRSDVFINIYDCGYLGDVLPGYLGMCFYIVDVDGNVNGIDSPSIDEVYDGPIEKDNEIDETSLTAYNNIGMVLDFLWNEWGRDSWDGMGSSVTGVVNFGPESGPTAINDASNSVMFAETYFPPDVWGPIPTNLMAFGNNKADGMAWSTSLDVVAHEFAHGMFWADVLDYYKFPLSPEWSPFYVDEPLAVDEHFCDVLAALLDKYVGKDDEAVYSIFEDLYPVGQPLRLMSNPAALSGTDWYSEKLVRPEDEDPDYQLNKRGYAYQTAGVANLAFYLLSEGGVHPNATKAGWTGITVQGIGIEIAGRIWNDARSDCLSIGALFTDVRACTELKAPDEFKNSVRQAWDAVGVSDSGVGSTIGGGGGNEASGEFSTIAGGYGNDATASYSFVGGGNTNEASGDYSFVGGGYGNNATGDSSFVGGGDNNTASEYRSTIGGGEDNVAAGTYSFVGGGYSNKASGLLSTIGGGEFNVAADTGSTVSGGLNNTASGYGSTIGGGDSNVAASTGSTVSGGVNNNATGAFSFIGGGDNNQATGDSSIAMGRNANAKKDRSLVINLGNNEASSNKDGEFLVNSDSFTLQIGEKKITIDEKNINRFEKLLRDENRRLEEITNQYEINKYVNKQQTIIEELHKQNEKQQEHNEKQQEQINELNRMMNNFFAQSSSE